MTGCGTTYGVVHSGGAGFTEGIGVHHEAQTSGRRYRAVAEAGIAYQPKQTAERGIRAHGSVGGVMRWDNISIGAGAAGSWYRSELADGSVWSRDALQPYAEVGYRWTVDDVQLRYLIPWDQDADVTDAWTVRLQYRMAILRRSRLISQISLHGYTQGEPKRSASVTFGYGVEWSRP